MKTPALLLLMLACACRSSDESRAPAEPVAQAQPPAPGRLPVTVVPVSYSLELTIDPDAERFSGETTIAVDLSAPSAHIFLHAQNLEVKRAQARPEGGEPLTATFKQVSDDGLAQLTLPGPIGPGRVTLTLAYRAPFDATLEGLFKVKQGDAHYAFTQFEPLAARRAFPCFDEPGFKTPFDVTLTVRQDHAAIANTTRLGEERIKGNMKRVRFARTAKLPTYLVAFAVGPLEVVQGPDVPASAVRERPIPLRAVSVAGRGDELSYALQQTPELVLALESHLGLPYPFDKLDLIAIPDFSAGAMENAGAITFRDAFLLMDEASASADQKQLFAFIMAHELAHQWFGNLVTMPWWDDLWLNEAFATYMESIVIAMVRPDYKPQLSALEATQHAMREDALVSARRMREPIVTPHDIMNAFDEITYSKGAAVIAMFEHYVGKERFRAALGHYLRKHSYGTAGVHELLGSLKESLGEDLSPAFSSFLEQSGVPHLEVTPRCQGGDASLELVQSRYLPLGSTGEAKRSWKIPVCVRYGIGTAVHQSCTLLTEERAVVPLEKKGCPSFVMPNADAAGYYRWSLPARDLAALMQKAKLSPAELLSTADNLAAAVSSGKLLAADAYGQLQAFAQSDERAVVGVPFALIAKARDYLVDAELRGKLELFAGRLAKAALKRAGTQVAPDPKADEETRLFRQDVLSFVADVARDPKVRAELAAAGRAFIGHGGDGKLHPEAVDPNLVTLALRVAVQEGDPAFHDAVIATLVATEDTFLRRQLGSALAGATDEALATRLRELALTDKVRTMEVGRLFSVQAARPENSAGTWKFVTERFEQLVGRLAGDDVGYVPTFAGAMCSRAAADEVERFMTPRAQKLMGAPRNLAATLEAIRLCAAFVEHQRESARAFFAPLK